MIRTKHVRIEWVKCPTQRAPGESGEDRLFRVTIAVVVGAAAGCRQNGGAQNLSPAHAITYGSRGGNQRVGTGVSPR
jgi:hypothetical protein